MTTVQGRGPTLLDVARVAGVSHTTVSRYLRGDPTVQPENAERIRLAVIELDYRPNVLARSMRQRQSGLLAIVLPATTNSFSPTRMVSPALAEAHRAGYEVEIVNVDGDAEARTRRVLELSDSRTVEGVLSLAALTEDGLRRVRPDAPPVIEVPHYDDELRGAGVLLDTSPIRTIIEHLATQGHRRFYLVGGPDDYPSARARRIEYEGTIQRLGLESAGWSSGPWGTHSGRDAVRKLDQDCGVTALVCVNDELAAGAIHAANERGWRVPEDVSVTGWDNNPLGEFLPPGLTTVHPDHELLGVSAMRLLISEVRGLLAPEVDYSTLHTVIWRGSTGPAPLTN